MRSHTLAILHFHSARILSLIFVLCTAVSLHAQDSLVMFNELTFHSDFEKETFRRFKKRDIDYFSLFMANGTLLREAKIRESEKKFYDHVTALGNETAAKKTDKRVRAVYDNIHKKFLAKYELKNRFEDIFYNGYYNCVSASALYGMAFEKLGIPYSIKEEPTHVYLVAYPHAERIILETTAALHGYYELSDEFKQRYLQTLKEQKLISQQEFASADLRALFDKYYFAKDGDISLLQLAGIQYSNDGVHLCEEKKFAEGFRQLEKAYMLYPSERIAYLLMYAGSQAFDTRAQKDSTQAVLLARLSRYDAYGITPDMIEAEFARVTQSLLSESGKKAEYAQYYTTLHGALRNQKLKDNIAFYYHYENARLLYNQAKYKESLPYIEKTLALKPNDQNTQGLFLGTLGLTLNTASNADIIKTLEEYLARFPELDANNRFNAMRASACLMQFYNSYQEGRTAEGDKFKGMFEGLADKYPDMYVAPELIGQSYSAAAVYFYRKGQVAKAKQLIATGLKYAPNNYELTTRQRMIK